MYEPLTEEDYFELCKEKLLTHRKRELYTKFMLTAFPKECSKSYAYEWVSRFNTNPIAWMDERCSEIYSALVNEIYGNKSYVLNIYVRANVRYVDLYEDVTDALLKIDGIDFVFVKDVKEREFNE